MRGLIAIVVARWNHRRALSALDEWCWPGDAPAGVGVTLQIVWAPALEIAAVVDVERRPATLRRALQPARARAIDTTAPQAAEPLAGRCLTKTTLVAEQA